MLRIHLPPNFIAAAARDAVPLKLDVDLERAPSPEFLPALALLQRWSNAPTPPKFIQLTRAQLRELAAAVGSAPVFVENGKDVSWRHAEVVAPAQVASQLAGEPAHGRTSKSSSPGHTPLAVDGSEHFLAITLPSREHPRYADALALMKENGFTLEPSNRKWWLRDRHKTLNFLATYWSQLRDSFGAEFTSNFLRNTEKLQTAEITTAVVQTGNDFSVTMALEAGSADEGAIRAAVAGNRGYLENNGKVYLLDSSKLQKLTSAQRSLVGEPNAALAPRRTQRVSVARAAEAQEILEALSPGFQSPEAWKSRGTALKNLTTLPPAPVPDDLNRQLRPYQRLGTAWLWHLFSHQLGGVLADEMGLGKTLQALALLSAVHGALSTKSSASAPILRRTPRPVSPPPADSSDALPSEPRSTRTHLVVCPASLLENWRREATRFAPQLRTFVHHATNRITDDAQFRHHDLVITSYGTLARDQERFAGVAFGVVIADEAQHIKNRRSQNAAALRALRATARFLLTGTPLENSLDDLRSLFEFILPGYLTKVPAGLRGDERSWYDDRLRAQTAPYILRRTKRAVAPELPEKLEHVIWCELTPAQERLYRETQETSERELIDLEAGGASDAKLKFAALTQLLRLRQICCDPRLVSPESPADISAKLENFNELLAEAIDDGHRVLVFSQFTSLLALLRADLEAQHIAFAYLDGSMPARARQAEVDRFQHTADIPLFLLSLKAGGTGLNLTGADTVVHFDPWWNPAAEAQATDRAHRIGQKRVVTSYKLIASGTVEEKVLALQAEKRALLEGVFDASDALAAKLSLADLKALLQ